MSHPSSRVEAFDNIRVEAKAFRKNWILYKSIGGSVEIRSESTSRSWKCLWLCKTRDKIKANRILLENQYFTSADGTEVLVTAALQEGECLDASDCTLKHSAFGIGVKLTFPNGNASPGTVSDLLPLEGVLSRSTIAVAGRNFSFLTASGVHPN